MEYLTQQQYMIESQNKYFIYVAFTNNSKVIYVIKLVNFPILYLLTGVLLLPRKSIL